MKVALAALAALVGVAALSAAWFGLVAARGIAAASAAALDAGEAAALGRKLERVIGSGDGGSRG